jgi:hypothetical protein
MTYRVFSSGLSSSAVICLVCFIVLSLASSALADNYRILIVREGGIDQESKLPTGTVIVKAGYIDGVNDGMTGTIWRKNKFKGRIDIADIEVVEARPYEAVCRFTVRHPDFYVLKKDRAALEPVERDNADILARGIEVLDNGLCFQALLYFERIFCDTQDNSFVQAKIKECQGRVEVRLAGQSAGEPRKMQLSDMVDYLELAERHHEFDNDLAADMYLKQVLAADSSNTAAAALREAVPDQDFAVLLSPARCD